MANFKLRYSPLFYEDLDKITDYVLLELKNELAVKALINNIELAIKKRLRNPLTIMTYQSINDRLHPYRRILVNNYLIFYAVIDNTMIIRRILYGLRDLDKIL
jgi:toxin ParE1/3/4